jgi:protein ImuA
MNSRLQALLARPDIWQASRAKAAGNIPDALPTGHAALDAALHQGGWPRAALTEVLGNEFGIGEMQLLLPSLAQCSRSGKRLFLVCPPHLPYAPAWLAQGVCIDRLLILSASHDRDVFWSVEQILRSGASACLLAWLPEKKRSATYQDLRRLQLAASAGNSPVFLFRPARVATALSPASLRLRVDATARELAIEIVKQRGGRSGQRLTLARPSSLLREQILATMLPVSMSAQRTPGNTDSSTPVRLPKPAVHEAVALH